MSTINPLDSSLYWQEPSNQISDSSKDQSLKQEDFFALLSQQLSMQDPFKPVDNDQMISQMASFASVDGINSLNSEIGNLNATMTSSQALQASSLVGKQVLIPSGSSYLAAGKSMGGVVTVPEGATVNKVRVEDAQGQLVAYVDLPGGQSGNLDFQWDGTDANGNPTAEGVYTFKAEATLAGESQELAVSTYAHVNSVSLGNGASGAVLNLNGLGGILLSDVLAVTEA
ncbi:flagellar hook assembly protein FlgD [Paraferrimonas sp. SM1919]|uniref:flagellar hook assembly protein FlgD n=1 Tax=Paraferrimonas sp. SM1919 TaxID=2662263 RepID=UPI0013D8D03D|nr:flagellar hook assembly protein FlgD [Paraferrimonas sp. SM1919]